MLLRIKIPPQRAGLIKIEETTWFTFRVVYSQETEKSIVYQVEGNFGVDRSRAILTVWKTKNTGGIGSLDFEANNPGVDELYLFVTDIQVVDQFPLPPQIS